MFMAFEIEKVYDKDTILELYFKFHLFSETVITLWRKPAVDISGKEPMEMNFDDVQCWPGFRMHRVHTIRW